MFYFDKYLEQFDDNNLVKYANSFISKAKEYLRMDMSKERSLELHNQLNCIYCELQYRGLEIG